MPTLIKFYLMINNTWIYINALAILPFMVSCVCRFKRPEISIGLWSDYLARFFLGLTVIFYIIDCFVKYMVDGADSICQKAFYIHHISSLVILTPLVMNKYIGWWICPVGFMHGFLLIFPEIQILSYIYVIFVVIFHYMICQSPYNQLWGYSLTRLFVNYIYIFCLMTLLGDCSNYLPQEQF